jgi:hypothetical protein
MVTGWPAGAVPYQHRLRGRLADQGHGI